MSANSDCFSAPDVESFLSFVSQFSAPGSLSTENAFTHAKLFLPLLASANQQISHPSYILSVCDALRICFRVAVQLTDCQIADGSNHLLSIVEKFLFTDNKDVSLAALKCLINFLINQPHRMQLFCTSSGEINGVDRLSSLVGRLNVPPEGAALLNLQYVVKILFMITSQSSFMSTRSIVSAGSAVSLVASLVSRLQQTSTHIATEYYHQHCSTGKLDGESVGVGDSKNISSSSVYSLYCEICSLLYALDAYSVLELAATINSNSGTANDVAETVWAGHPWSVSIAATKATTTLNHTIFDILMLNNNSSGNSNSIATAEETNRNETLSSAELSLSECQQHSLQLCMVASDNVLHQFDLSAVSAPADTGNTVNTAYTGNTVPPTAKTINSDSATKCSNSSSGHSSSNGNSSGVESQQVHIMTNIMGHLSRRILKRHLVQASEADLSDRAYILTPILIFLNKIIQFNSEARAALKSVVFPTEASFRAKSNGLSVPVEKSERQKFYSKHAMDPPKYTNTPSSTDNLEDGYLRDSLLKCMTSLDSQVKRCAAELLFTLCDENTDEFVFRTGFGNAIALLQLKGLL